ncbi:hypothetical protein PIB30_043983 [Stylosanthes scabra]|uniref:Uncharacterized protein n=1 Tax=Stylosanthes scabra TaxID=79078 RepID=A0ABU6SFZ4_9FABA|nr:hypothetical protein [Stylosanthes scabra]
MCLMMNEMLSGEDGFSRHEQQKHRGRRSRVAGNPGSGRMDLELEVEVYEKTNGGKKKALEDGEVVTQSSKCENSDTQYRYLLLGIDTYDTQRQHKAQSIPRASSSVTQVQDHARTAPPPCLGMGFHHSPRVGVAGKPKARQD